MKQRLNTMSVLGKLRRRKKRRKSRLARKSRVMAMVEKVAQREVHGHSGTCGWCKKAQGSI
jgi:hypothetical protein